MKMLKKMLQERRAMPRKQQSDFFDYVVEELQKEGTILTEAIALDLMFVLLFASFETTSLAITCAVKFLSDNPLVYKQLEVRKKYITPFIMVVLFSDFSTNCKALCCAFIRKNMKPFLNDVKILTPE